MAIAKTEEAQQAEWKAEWDARALADAAAIRADAKRFNAARKAAKRLLKDEEKTADDAEARLKALRELASGKGGAKRVVKARRAQAGT